ncbi:alkaline phosphatase family protein [Schaalia sp. lx-260]|uniref:alkaline phosphatase family protein n=1 Tax=Schaalia sp. lx-260 TaxID=2899082 RepID=UPI001E3A7C4F|nr:alkaline phosphatase family protein [Schaalia sp. lx-260]MCD4549484.1 alkaline phosphatase family protein [Schaalia sp. lx-260]
MANRSLAKENSQKQSATFDTVESAKIGEVPALNLPSQYEDACIPCEKDLQLTEIFGAAIAALDPNLPGALPDITARIGCDKAQRILLIMVDGLGYEALSTHYGHAPTLRSLRSSTYKAHTVIPSTTAAAITAFTTGEKPGRTRMTGYSVAVDDEVMNLLAFREGIDPSIWQPVTPYFSRLAEYECHSVVITPATFSGSGLSRAALRGARHVPASTWAQRCSEAVRELRAGTPVVYLYWSDIDHVGHKKGIHSYEWAHALEDFDAGLSDLLRQIPSDTCALLTADHGMVNVDQKNLIDCSMIAALSESVRIVAGETRAVHVHCQSGTQRETYERWSEFLGERAWIVPAENITDLIGEGPGKDQVGDFVVFSRGRGGIVDSRTQNEQARNLTGVHGSLTSAEMHIPVIRLA